MRVHVDLDLHPSLIGRSMDRVSRLDVLLRTSISTCLCCLLIAPAAEAATPDRPSPTVVDTALGLAMMGRHFEVGVMGSPEPRTYSAPAFLELTAGAEFYPLALAHGTLPARGLGLFFTYRHNFVWLETTGMTDDGAIVEIDTVEQELLAGVLFRLALGEQPSSPSLMFSLGGGYFEFRLDPRAMARLPFERQMPTMVYRNIVATTGVRVPFGTPAIEFQGTISGRWVLDVGQAARDLFGSATDGGSGFDVSVGLAGQIAVLHGMHWSALAGITSFKTQFSGVGQGALVDAFSDGTDRYLRILALAGYALP